jgi:hypothetical protein
MPPFVAPPNTPVTIAIGPHQYGYIYSGLGRPQRIDLKSGDVVPSGVDAPSAAPVVTASGSGKFYIPRIDMVDYGRQYHSPPTVTITGACTKPAAALSFLKNGQLEYISVTDYGKGYTATPAVSLSESHSSGLVLTPVLATPAKPGEAVPVSSITVTAGGSQYLTPPGVTINSVEGYGLSVKLEVANGKVTTAKVLDGGAGYKTAPVITPVEGGATAVAIARPHLKGKYQCYYRHVDNTPGDRTNDGQPVPSNLSPVCEVDTGDGAEKLLWAAYSTAKAAAGDRGVTLERWRTTGNQAFTLYRVVGELDADDLTDEELRDPDRPGYLAMGILLPNGELNANRFGIPPSDLAVAVMFQDRLWCAVDPDGERPNTLQYSEVGEPESMPDINELILQTNVKGADQVTALIPIGGALLAMQNRHHYRLTYVSQPLIDCNVAVGGYRGCIGQRCWDEQEGVIYSMDTLGVYAIDASGRIKSISDGISNLFSDKIDFARSKWFSVVADSTAYMLRCSVRFKEDGDGEYPTRMLCYSFQTESWWEERYPAPLVGGTAITTPSGQRDVVYGSREGRAYRLGKGGSDDADGSIEFITVTDAGSGYTQPPKVRAPGGQGAVIESAITAEGQLLGIYVRLPGYGYADGALEIEPPADGTTAKAKYSVTSERIKIPYSFKTGNMEYQNDSIAQQGLPDGGARNIAVLFTPTEGQSDLKLRMYYNNKSYPRVNVVDRDRGTGFVADASEPVTRIDMDAGKLPENISSGVCRALFAGKTIDDVRGNDRHLSLELSGEVGDEGPVVIHQLDVFGVPSPQPGA